MYRQDPQDQNRAWTLSTGQTDKWTERQKETDKEEWTYVELFAEFEHKLQGDKTIRQRRTNRNRKRRSEPTSTLFAEFEHELQRDKTIRQTYRQTGTYGVNLRRAVCWVRAWTGERWLGGQRVPSSRAYHRFLSWRTTPPGRWLNGGFKLSNKWMYRINECIE